MRFSPLAAAITSWQCNTEAQWIMGYVGLGRIHAFVGPVWGRSLRTGQSSRAAVMHQSLNTASDGWRNLRVPDSPIQNHRPLLTHLMRFIVFRNWFMYQSTRFCLSTHQVPADEVCGCPLVKDVFEPTGEFCRVSKRKCNKHYCWEKLRRAEVDLERVRVVRTKTTLSTSLTPASWLRLTTWCHSLSVSGTNWTSCSSRRGTWGQPWPTELVYWLWYCTRRSSTTQSPLTCALPRTGRQVKSDR